MTARLRSMLAMPVLALLGGVLLGQIGPAFAEHPAECHVANRQSEIDFPLPQVAKAIAAKVLRVLVVGAGSSQLPGAEGAKNSYPARLQLALSDKLPGVAVTVATNVQAGRTAADMVKAMPAAIAKASPHVMVWQTATVDAVRSVDPDQFSQTLDKGIDIARAAKADVVFLNPQYSPRTESMIALAIYAENMRWVALQREVPLFDRFDLMKAWADLGTFDLYSATNKLDMAERVHDCLGRLLAGLIIEAAKTAGAQTEGQR